MKKGDPKGRLAKSRKLVPEARVELARRETTVFETAASAIPPLGHISLHSITEARIRVHDKIAPRLALLSPRASCLPAPRSPRCLPPRRPSSCPPRPALPRRSAAVRFRSPSLPTPEPRACPPRSSSSHPPFANRTIAGCSRAAHWGKVGAIATRPRRLPRGRRSCGRDRFVSREELGKHRCGHRARRAHREYGRPAGGKTRRTVRPRPPSCPHRGARHCARHGLWGSRRRRLCGIRRPAGRIRHADRHHRACRRGSRRSRLDGRAVCRHAPRGLPHGPWRHRRQGPHHHDAPRGEVLARQGRKAALHDSRHLRCERGNGHA